MAHKSLKTTIKPRCYAASPSGFAESTRFWYYGKLLPMLNKYVTVDDPWDIRIGHVLEASPEEQPDLWMDIGDQQYDRITKCKLMVAVLDQEPPDNGTAGEVVWAAAHGIPVLGYRSDIRNSGEPNLPYNLMIAAAIRRSGGVQVSTFAGLEQTVEDYTLGLQSGNLSFTSHRTD